MGLGLKIQKALGQLRFNLASLPPAKQQKTKKASNGVGRHIRQRAISAAHEVFLNEFKHSSYSYTDEQKPPTLTSGHWGFNFPSNQAEVKKAVVEKIHPPMQEEIIELDEESRHFFSRNQGEIEHG